MLYVALFAGRNGMYVRTQNNGRISLPCTDLHRGESPSDAATRVARQFNVDILPPHWTSLRLVDDQLVLWVHLPVAEDMYECELNWPMSEFILEQAWRDPKYYGYPD